MTGGQNTEKSPGDFMRLVVSQTPVEDHQRLLMGKILKEYNNNNDFFFKLLRNYTKHVNTISAIP